MTNLNGRIAVVTGASRGLGRRIAVRLAQQGAAVALLARSEAGLVDTRQEIAAKGARSLVVPVDLGKPEAVLQVKGVIENDLGIPSILVNAAGIFGPIDLVKDSDPTAWIETIMINTIRPSTIALVAPLTVVIAGSPPTSWKPLQIAGSTACIAMAAAATVTIWAMIIVQPANQPTMWPPSRRDHW